MREFIQTVKRLNSSTRYSIYKVESNNYSVEKWGLGAFPLDVVTLDVNQAYLLKHIKDSKLPKFVCNAVIALNNKEGVNNKTKS